MGGFTSASASLQINEIVLIDKIPERVNFSYKAAGARQEFGANGKILPNIADLLSIPSLTADLYDQVDQLSKFSGARVQTKIGDLVGKINGQGGSSNVILDWIENNLLGDLEEIGCLKAMAMFNLAIDSKLRGCDLVSLHVRDIAHGNQVLSRSMVMQSKTKRPVQFELTEATRDAVSAWIVKAGLKTDQYLFPSRLHRSSHISTRQYARVVHQWATAAGLDTATYGTHSMRRTKATLIYRRTKNLRAVQLLLGHARLESTVRDLGIEVDDALEISEQTEI